jgi:hypothetical protein
LWERNAQLFSAGTRSDELAAETRLDAAEELGRYFAEAEILVQQGKRIPARVERAAGQLLDGTQEFLFIAGPRR